MIAMTMLLAAIAQPPAAAPAKDRAASSKKIVCRLESEAYSRIPTRICRTQAEWDEIAKQTEADLKRSTNQRVIAPNPESD